MPGFLQRFTETGPGLFRSTFVVDTDFVHKLTPEGEYGQISPRLMMITKNGIA